MEPDSAERCPAFCRLCKEDEVILLHNRDESVDRIPDTIICSLPVATLFHKECLWYYIMLDHHTRMRLIHMWITR